ncbi:hypothetical protein C8J57DRAFT_1232678 [Mycena rebaudengoi]|nr:hypothetical protein C8J57DRAFT_1232678 [Mycena rebaudengoi]
MLSVTTTLGLGSAAVLTFILIIVARSFLLSSGPSATAGVETETKEPQRNLRPHFCEVLSEVQANSNTTWKTVMPFSATLLTTLLKDERQQFAQGSPHSTCMEDDLDGTAYIQLGITIAMPVSQNSNGGGHEIVEVYKFQLIFDISKSSNNPDYLRGHDWFT